MKLLLSIDALKQMTCLTITPDIAANVIGVDPQSIRAQAQEDPGKLGFRVIVLGSRTMIPREPFIQFLTGT